MLHCPSSLAWLARRPGPRSWGTSLRRPALRVVWSAGSVRIPVRLAGRYGTGGGRRGRRCRFVSMISFCQWMWGQGGIVLTRPRQFSVSVPLGRTGQEHVTRDPMRRWADDAAMSAWQTTRPCVGQPRPTEALCSYRCHEPGGRFHDLAHVSALVNIWQVDSGPGDEPTNAATYSIFQPKIAGSGAGSAGRYGSGCLAVGDSTRASHVIELGTVVRYCVRQTQPV
jgi:hypothetical protein